MEDTTYLAFIADIKDSRQIDERNNVQEHLKGVLKQLNNQYQNQLISPFEIVMGDSFQALFKEDVPLGSILLNCQLNLFPIKIRIGWGLGKLTTEVNSNSHLNDGPAYHRAKKMVEQIEQGENQNGIQQTNSSIDSSNEQNDALINAIFSLLHTIQENWTANQITIIKTYLNNDEQQIKTAKALGINQSTVSRSLKTSNFYEYQYAINMIDSQFEKKGV